MHGQKYRSAHGGGRGGEKKSAYTCHGLLHTWSQMLPSSPVGNYSSLKGCWGTLGVAGRGGLCVRVSKREVGVAPDVCSKGASTAQHTSTSQRRRLTPDLYPSTPAGPKQRGGSTPYIKVTYLISYSPESQLSQRRSNHRVTHPPSSSVYDHKFGEGLLW